MPIGFPSLRVDESNDTPHLWCNNGTWWLHYTVHFHDRLRRIRKSLRTGSLEETISQRDNHLRQLSIAGEFVPDRRPTRIAAARQRNGIPVAGPVSSTLVSIAS